MRRTRELLIHILPVVLGVIFTVFLSALMYHQMLLREEENSWEQLDVVALTVAEKITLRFEDNINLIERVADAISLKGNDSEYADVLEYLQSVQKSTIFERIDILLPNNTLVHQNGKIHPIRETDLPYDLIATRGSHYSSRDTDEETGRYVIYCAAPIYTDGEIEGILIGVVDCLKLSELIKTYSFEGTAEIFLVDRADGNYLMDNWQENLGNINDTTRRKRLKGFEDVDFRRDMLDGVPGHIAFVSQNNGQESYMSYMPVEGFNWSVAVMAQEDQVLKNVKELSVNLNRIALVEIFLLLTYVAWDVFVGYTLVKQRENVQKMELEAETTKAKNLFLSSVSHDIRTPLNGILGMLDVIDRRPDVPENLGQDLEKIRISAEYLVTLADNVLDLNDLESGKGPMEDDHIDLRKLGPDLQVIVQERLRNSTVSFHIQEPDLEHPWVLGSDGYLHRILTNLIGNAIKYNKEDGSIWVTIEEVEVQDGGSLYRFTVSDDGIGMSEEFQEKLFRAFEQENSGARSKNSGHGLGLAIVDRMVRRMGGTITVESQKNVGSIFTIVIPFRWDPTGGQNEQPQIQETGAGLEGARILLAEDNELNMEIAQVLLTGAGAQVTPAMNGRQAVEAFSNSEPYYFDVILMDIMMPEMDGCEAAQAIRRIIRPDAKKIPIIAMTASTFAEDIKRCRDAGMNEHIGKPLNMDNLFALVAKHREAYSQRKAAAGRSK